MKLTKKLSVKKLTGVALRDGWSAQFSRDSLYDQTATDKLYVMGYVQ